MIKHMAMKGMWVFTLIIALPCYSQDNGVFAPFVSQLKAEIRNHIIGLSWQDSLDIKGPVYVYRSGTPFLSASSLPVPVKEVSYGEGFYAEEADDAGALYYFIVASDDWGYKYPLFLPNINMVSINVGPEYAGIFAPFPSSGAAAGFATASGAATGSSTASGSAWPSSSASTTAAASGLRLPTIEGISVRIEEDRAFISFSGADNSKNLVLYRSINPIRRPDDLLSALIIRSNARSPLVDYPLPGIPYYYAVVYEEELSTGLLRLQPGFNVTAAAVEIPTPPRTVPRGMPLPDLSVSLVPGRSTLTTEEALRAEASINQRSGQSRIIPEAVIFPEDLMRGSAGEEYQIRSIVQGSFSLKEWQSAEVEFRRFLELPREKRSQAKVHFYLGQVYYFQNKQREALLSFLEAQDIYPAETYSWIQAVLSGLSK
jgi:tetratricopeptide (TPR) repeat protein